MFNKKINIINGDCCQVMNIMKEHNITVDLTITSPPYDDLMTYNDSVSLSFEKFKEVAKLLYDVTADGGVVVWVVGDAVKNGSESGSSFRQALFFMECGFKLHDTMIYEKNSSSFTAIKDSKTYTQIFEYMFVFVKGKNTQYNKEGNLEETEKIKEVPQSSLKNNIWKFTTSFNGKTRYQAVFPQQLATDYILSWSREGDTIFDPFLGSGTIALSAIRTNRKFIGCEIDDTYFNICNKRVIQELNS